MVGVGWLVALTALASVGSESAPEQQCQEQTNPTIKFSFNSQRNETGFWITKFDVENGGATNISTGSKATPSWSVGMEQSAVACGGRTSTLHSKITLALSDVNAKTKPIPGGYELFPGVGYYKFHPDAANWARARQVCTEEGAHLIVINSEYEANVVKQLFTRFPKEKITNYDHGVFEWCWIGIYEQSQTFNMTGFSRWHRNQPSEVGTDECLVVNAHTAGLGDSPCQYKAPFICEL